MFFLRQVILYPSSAGQFSPKVLLFFYTMIYIATLGINGILVEASLNIATVKIAKQHGVKITFRTFQKDEIFVKIGQLLTINLYLTVFFLS